MLFKDVLIGHSFFDPFCGEYFIKTDIDKAEMISGGDYLERQQDTFLENDIVEMIEGE